MMGKAARRREQRWTAYSYAAAAVACHLGRVAEIGDIDLDDADYVTDRLHAIGDRLGLDLTSEAIPGPALMVLNWLALAQVEAGRSRAFLLGQHLGRFPGVDQLGVLALREHWSEIARLAEALLKKGHISAAEVIAIIGDNYVDASNFDRSPSEAS